jgi:hypothetical protein
MSAAQPKNQTSHVPPYYFFASDQEEKLQALWQKRSGAKRRWRSLLSRRSARR